MTFKHKLSCRLAMLKDRRAICVAATLAAAVVASCVLPAAASAPVGGTVQFVAVPLDATGTALGGRIIVWASSNQAVANVNTSGIATAAATGSTTIAATSEGHSGTATLTVTAVTVPVASVTGSPA